MKNKNKVNGTDTFVPEFHLTSRPNLLKSLNETDFVDEDATIRIKAIREARVMLDEIIKNDSTTALYRCQPQAARVSWVRRVLSWFRRG